MSDYYRQTFKYICNTCLNGDKELWKNTTESLRFSKYLGKETIMSFIVATFIWFYFIYFYCKTILGKQESLGNFYSVLFSFRKMYTMSLSQRIHRFLIKFISNHDSQECK